MLMGDLYHRHTDMDEKKTKTGKMDHSGPFENVKENKTDNSSPLLKNSSSISYKL